MKRHILSLIALLLCLTMVLCACGQEEAAIATRPSRAEPTTMEPSVTEPAEPTDPTLPSEPQDPAEPDKEIPHFSEMTYTRPDSAALLASLDKCEQLADGDKDPLIAAIEEYVELLSNFLTNQRLAQIHYNLDLTDKTWEEEFNFCNESIVTIQSRQDAMLRKLAACPYREDLETEDLFGEDFFDDYDGESIWTDTFTALMDQELALQTEYYAVYAEATATGYIDDAGFNALAELYVEMVKLRQQIAREAGYDNYSTYAYELEYNRDFTPAAAQAYIDAIAMELAPMYLEISQDSWFLYGLFEAQDRPATFAYVEKLAAAAGGSIAECFNLMNEHGLYNIALSEKKMDSSFCIFLPDYMVPYVFVNPTGTNYDSLTFTHEFGHFCNGYLSEGEEPGIDVAEFFSQGLEYLSLSYGTGGLDQLAMFSSLGVYVEQSMYADFELAVYNIPEDQLSVEALRNAFGNTLKKFGMYSDLVDETSFVAIPHFYVSPQYVISYVVSNDAALQLYQMELLNPGSGLTCYMDNLSTDEDQLLSFLQSAGLESPFADGRITDVKETFENVLK